MYVSFPFEDTMAISTYLNYALSSAAISSIGVSLFINNTIVLKDIINGTLAGGIACASASFYFSQPWPAFLTGIVAGSVQTILQNSVEKKIRNSNFHIISTYSLSLFGLQGLIGGIFGSIFQAAYAS